MAWQGIEGHDEIVEKFRTAVGRDRLASTFLFVGPEGIGKRSFALKLAQALLCTEGAPLEPCLRCPSCRLAASANHPDLLLVSKPPDKAGLPVALLIGDGERRGREGLCHDLGLRPMMSGRRVAIIDDADELNDEGANCLLKTLEEPPPASVLILISTSIDRQLPTIRSRCQTIRFKPLAPEALARLLLEQDRAANPAEAERLAAYAEGSFTAAKQLADKELWDFRRTLLEELSAPTIRAAAFSKSLSGFIDQAGKDAPSRRTRFRLLVRFALELFQELHRRSFGVASEGDPDLAKAAARGAAHWTDADLTMLAVERCLEAHYHIGRFANQTSIVECWLDDLARLLLGRKPLFYEAPR